MEKRVLIGTVSLNHEKVMTNLQFQYAASFEELLVPEGEYPITAYEGDLVTRNGVTALGWRNYIEFEGTVIRGNVGGKPGDKTSYCPMEYDYDLAELFLKGHTYSDGVLSTFSLRPEWDIVIHDFISDFDGQRKFVLGIRLKDGADLPYMDQE